MPGQPRPCRACSSLVFDLEHIRTRRASPIDARPDPKGNIIVDLEGGLYTVAKKEWLDKMTPDERAKLHTTHLMTCAYASRFRKPKERGNADRDERAS